MAKKIILAIAVCFCILTAPHPSVSQDSGLPPLKIHPLPYFLANWQDAEHLGDYFDRVNTTPLGHLVWSRFPLKIYLEKPETAGNTAEEKRFQAWRETVKEAIAQWNDYLPLIEIDESETADIIILRSQPAREIKPNPETGLFDIPRAIAAETTYEFYLTKDNPSILAHKMTVQISSAFVGKSLLATARHELGHALGIWGHSPEITDTLYYSQVRNPLPISKRDINTLKKIYQQPTRLGWEIKRSQI